uniref:Dehydrogenase/reductase SDR family member 11 n=2 Tax=Timema TaxID=61471 RepID=A0A7R9IH90_9NEOP|nr:unnamed protein product [Timema bartmani]CAD7458350.1 unnamed protein product [Timema tahoe]
MERWSGRVALVTGASIGIGAAIAKELVKHGVIVVGLARRVHMIQELSKELHMYPGKLYGVKADLSKEEDILEAFTWVKDNLGGVDILVNNAGVISFSRLADAPSCEWRQAYAIHVIAPSICIREAFRSMKDREVDDGHIVNILSITTNHSPESQPIIMYFASKQSLRVLTEGLRRELVQLNSKIRVTGISPGLVDTIEDTASPEERDLFKGKPSLNSEDVAHALIFALSAPSHVQIHELTIRPVGEQ